MRKYLIITFVVLLALVLVSGCSGSKYKDGTWKAESQPDDYGNTALVEITIKDGKITDVVWKEMSNGKEKDEDYGKKDGKIENQENYDKAQKAIKASKTYGDKLVEVQDINKVDAISGATRSHETFVSLVKEALEKAKK
ncbi:MAG: FMN-binding protein [Firmicutes bacterium]|nr:FMN-binding protein [Bacillota bacterium]